MLVADVQPPYRGGVHKVVTDEAATGTKDTHDLGQSPLPGNSVVQHRRRQHEIEPVVGKRQLGGIGPLDACAAGKGNQGLRSCADHLGVVIDGDHPKSRGCCEQPGVDQIVRSALRSSEQTLMLRLAGRLSADTETRLETLIATDDQADDEPHPDERHPSTLLSVSRQEAGNVSLDTMLTEIEKLAAVRAIGLPPGLFDDVAKKVAEGWRARAAVESPSHLRDHPHPLRLTLLAALLDAREREITDTLVDLLIATVHRIGARAEKRVNEELVAAFRRATGKENILFRVADAACAAGRHGAAGRVPGGGRRRGDVA